MPEFINRSGSAYDLGFIGYSRWWKRMFDAAESGWLYRKSHTVNAATGAGTGYQVKIKVYYASGTDSGEAVYVGGKCQADFDDVRFTGSDGITPLDYWMETYTASTSAVFWVKVAEDLSSVNRTIYIYYGNNSATLTTSDGAAVFPNFFDHFPGSSVDTGKWTVAGTPTVSGSFVTLYREGGVNETITSISSFTTSVALRARLRMWNVNYSVFQLNGGGNNTVRTPQWAWPTAAIFNAVTQNDAGNNTTDMAMTAGTLYTVESRRTSTNTYHFKDDAQIANHARAMTLSSTIYASAYSTDTAKLELDWVLMRKFVLPEPVHGSWETEETL